MRPEGWERAATERRVNMRYIKMFLQDDKAYFANCKASITAQNNRMLADGCILYSFVLLFYTLFSLATKQSAFLRNLYFVFDGFHVALTIAVFTRPARIKGSHRATQLYCIALETAILGFFALEGALVSATQHSLYVPIAILLVQLLFIHSAWYSVTVIFLYTFIFALLSYLYKTPEAFTNDLYIAIATFMAANIGYMLIAKLRRSEQQALTRFENLSRTDALTGLNNKATVEHLCQRVIAEGSQACTLLIIDLDDFKTINDQYGHSAGDEVLTGIGGVIKRVFRVNDILGRFGGDEFVVLMDACSDPEVVRERMEALRRRVSECSFSVPGLAVRCSAGVAFKRDGDDFRSLFTRADQALYAAKRSGKNCFSFERDE